jgi:hypothetical protein
MSPAADPCGGVFSSRLQKAEISHETRTPQAQPRRAKTRDGVALIFDYQTWEMFEQTASLREQSAQHMITRAVVNCLRQIVEDNMVLNQMLRGPD